MPGLLTAVCNLVPESCRTSRLRKEGCSIALQGTPSPRLIIDFDKRGSPLAPDARRCDYLLLAETSNRQVLVRPIELKRGKFDLSDVRSQLQAGAQAAETLIPQNLDVDFLPVLASGGVSTSERITRETVRFRGKPARMTRVRCGDPLP